jgi:hypothetical protein
VTAEQGLPTTIIYDLYCAADGYLYLGMEVGLARFNGTDFHLFQLQNHTSRSLDEIQQSSDGTIWCKNFTNQIFYLHQDTLIAHYTINETIRKSGPLRNFLVHKRGIYFLTDKDLFLYTNTHKLRLVMQKSRDDVSDNFVELLEAKNPDGLYVLDGAFAYYLDGNGKVIRKRALIKGQNTAAVFDSTLVTTPKSDLRELIVKGKPVPIAEQAHATYLNKLVALEKGLWLCTNKGLIPYNAESQSMNEVYFENMRVTDIAQDLEGGYWVSTLDRGLFYMPSAEVWCVNPSDYSISRLIEGPNKSFFAGAGNGNIFHFSASGDLLNSLRPAFDSEVEFLYYDRKRRWLISSHGVFDFNRKNAYTPVKLGKFITKDSLGNFLLNTYNQAILIHQDFQSTPTLPTGFAYSNVEEYSHLSIPYIPLYGNRSNGAYFNEERGVFYLASFEGLHKIKPGQYTKKIRFEGKDFTPLYITGHLNKELLISTANYGVLKLNGDSLSSFYNTQNGLSSNYCKKVLVNFNCLFVLTDYGIDVINQEKKTVYNLSEGLSLRNLHIFDFIFIGSKMYLATDRGVLFFNIENKESTTFPTLKGLYLQVGSESLLESNPTLDYSNNDVHLLADAIYFKNLGNFVFSYRLLGYDSLWQEQSSKNNTFNYLALPPGNYSFELRMKVNGKYSRTYTQAFSISRPFWQSPWFFVLSFLLVVLFSYLIFRKLLTQQRKKQLLNQRLLHSQLVSLRAQMNPHFMFNIVNSVQGLIYSNKRNEASKLLGKMAMLLRKALDVSDRAKISIQEELEILENYVELEAVRFEDDFHYEIKSNIPKDLRYLHIPSLIVQPFVENAIKHGLMHKDGPKELHIEVNQDPNGHITIKVQDNGIGRKAADRINAKRRNHQSFAAHAIETRISLINQVNPDLKVALEIIDLVNESGKPKGTLVIIQINNRN